MLNILFEDNHLIIVNKNPGELTQGDITGDETLGDKIKAYLKKKYNLTLIQDAAQSLGSKVGKKHITEFADFTIFSFQAIKHITSGDGGMLTFKNKKLLEKSYRAITLYCKTFQNFTFSIKKF